MYYSYVEIEYVAMSFSPARTDLAVKLLSDDKKYNKLDVISRKRKSTDFFCEIPQTKRGKPPPGQMKNMFFLWFVKVMRRSCHSKLTEHVAFLAKIYRHFLGIGHIRFGHPHVSLNESCVPKAVLTPSLGSNSIQKCLWILRQKFKFQTTQKN